MSDQLISDLASQLLQREMEKNPDQFRTAQNVAPEQSGGMSPQTLATLGGLVDAASTYAFMKRGPQQVGNHMVTHRESNPMVNTSSPEMAGLSAIGGLLASKGLTHLIGKKWPGVADALAANLGALQLGYGVQNFAKTFNKQPQAVGGSSASEWGNALIRNLDRGSSVK